MKALAPIVVALLVAPPVAFATNALATDSGAPEERAQSDDEVAEAETRAALKARIAALDERLEAVARAAQAQALPARREAVDALESAITAALDRRAIRVDPDAVAVTRAARAEAHAKLVARVDAALASGDDMALAQTFATLAENGQLDSVLAELARRAEAAPGDVGAASDLARAAVAGMNTVPYGPRMAHLGQMADEAFQSALEVAPERDDLRFERAQVLAQSPSFLGLRTEAIRELETLVQRGESGGNAQAESYRMLGTLLLDHGEHERALEAWQRGAGAFPDNQTLQELLRLHGRE